MLSSKQIGLLSEERIIIIVKSKLRNPLRTKIIINSSLK